MGGRGEKKENRRRGNLIGKEEDIEEKENGEGVRRKKTRMKRNMGYRGT